QWSGNKRRSDAQVAGAVREYRKRYPEKAVLCSLDRAGGWAVLAAGGSLANLPRLTDDLLAALPRMRPFEPAAPLAPGQYALAEPGRHYLVHAAAGGKARLDLRADPESYKVRRIDPRTDRISIASEVRGGQVVELTAGPGGWVLWLSRR